MGALASQMALMEVAAATLWAQFWDCRPARQQIVIEKHTASHRLLLCWPPAVLPTLKWMSAQDLPLLLSQCAAASMLAEIGLHTLKGARMILHSSMAGINLP